MSKLGNITKEYPHAGPGIGVFVRDGYGHRASTEMERLMQEPPGPTLGLPQHWRGYDQPSLESTLELREALADAFDTLTEEEQFIADRFFIENLSLRRTGRMMNIPKTTLARRRDAIRRKLLLVITADSRVRDWLTRDV